MHQSKLTSASLRSQNVALVILTSPPTISFFIPIFPLPVPHPTAPIMNESLGCSSAAANRMAASSSSVSAANRIPAGELAVHCSNRIHRAEDCQSPTSTTDDQLLREDARRGSTRVA
ncbi:hypothetical protein ACOSP7_014648 [Xanthoceras sorbifolium]